MPRLAKQKLKTSDFGQVHAIRLDADTEMAQDGFEWKPNRRVIRALPNDYSLRFRILRDANGVRKIVPTTTLRQFVITAAVGGLAILSRSRRTSGEYRYAYRQMSLLYQWSFSDRRLMMRPFRRSEDLRLRKSERNADGERNILPQELSHGDNRWTPSRLLKAGSRAARSAGLSSPSIDHQIAYGLLEAASEFSSTTSTFLPENSERFLRFSLFGENQGQRVSRPQDASAIQERLLDAVHAHLDLDTDEFDRWLYRDFDNLVQQLSQRRSSENITRQKVRGVLFDLLWQSFQYMSDFVRMQMQAVRLAIAPKLNERERHLFGVWYDAQEWTAGLAPMVLHSCPKLLQPTLQWLERVEENDETPWRCFLQALLWRSEMVRNRRLADARQKQSIGRAKTFSLQPDRDFLFVQDEFDELDEDVD